MEKETSFFKKPFLILIVGFMSLQIPFNGAAETAIALSKSLFKRDSDLNSTLKVLEIDTRDHESMLDRPSQLFNISLLEYVFPNNENFHGKRLYSMVAIGSDRFYLGAVNHVYRIDLKRHALDEQKDGNRSDNSSKKIIQSFDGKYFFEFVLYNSTLVDGPYQTNERCLPNISHQEKTAYSTQGAFADNHIVQLFYFNNILFACGTGRCGLCNGISPDLMRSRIFGSRISYISSGDSDSLEQAKQTDYDLYLTPSNFIGSLDSSHGSLIFFGNHHKASQILYTGFSNDGRDHDLEIPFITSRVLQSYDNGSGRRVFGFNYTRVMDNERSLIRLKSHHFYFSFITGFSYKRFAYFLFMEYYEPYRNYSTTNFQEENDSYKSSSSNKSQWPRLRLGRLCEDDPSPLHSYMEITLKCDQEFTIAQAAHLSVQLIGNENDGYRHYDDEEYESLLIGFNRYSETNAEDNKDSVVCIFRMDQIEQHFLNGFNDCNGIGHFTKWLYKLHGHDTRCKYTDTSEDQELKYKQFCPHNPANRYIDFEVSFIGQKIIHIKGDHISSLGSIRTLVLSSRFISQKKIHHIFIGTIGGSLYKFLISDRVIQDFVIQLPEPLLSTQNVTLDIPTATFFLLTHHRLIRFPITSCSIYSTCSSCFRSKLHRVEYCYWHRGHCYLKQNLPLSISTKQPRCPPMVYSFEPHSGPVSGGTELTFYGENFGEYPIDGESANSFLKITVDGLPCRIFERFDKMAKCKIEGTHQQTSSGKIIFNARDFFNIVSRKFQIEGSVEVEGKFSFLQPWLKGVHPPYGPFLGGTKILLLGQHLNIGTNLTIWIRDQPCKLLAKCSKYIICETPRTQIFDHPVSKEIKVMIDDFEGKLESNNPFNISWPETILNDDNNEFWEDSYHEMDQSDQIARCKHKINIVQDEYMILDSESDHISMQQLFLFRFNKLTNENTTAQFNENFQYRRNPSIKKVSNLVSIFSGNTTINFFGENFQSISYPELELLFKNPDGDYQLKKNSIRILTICRHRPPVNKNSLPSIACYLPPLSQLNINERNINYCIDAQYRLHLDGYIKDSNKFSSDLPITGPIIYCPDPKFELQKNTISVSVANRSLPLYGKNLRPDLPISIMVHNRYPCHLIYDNLKNFDNLYCSIQISNEEIESLIGQPMNVTAMIGSKNYELDLIEFKPAIEFLHKSSTIFTWVIAAVLIMLMLILLGLSLLWSYVRRHLPDKSEYDRVDSHEMNEMKINNFNQQISKYFDDAFPEDGKEILAEMYSKNMILTDTSRLEFIQGELDQGHYGVVFKGRMDGDPSKLVAVKIIKDSCHTPLLLQEMKVMKDFQHRNVISFMYITLVWPPQSTSVMPLIALVSPYMHHKDLHSYVKDGRNSPTLGDIINYSIQIAEGMDYLSQKNFVHRDLAARNCLLDANGCVKISDFGLSRFYNDNKEYYKAVSKDQGLPIKWMALESLKTFHFTTKSDVWSYAVLVWELYTRGIVPYSQELPETSPKQDSRELLINYLESGYRLSKPFYIPNLLWIILLRCWIAEPQARLTFKEIVEQLHDAVKMFAEKGANVQQKALSELTMMKSKSSQHFNFAENSMSSKLNDHYRSVRNHYMALERIQDSDLFDGYYDNENLQDDFGNKVSCVQQQTRKDDKNESWHQTQSRISSDRKFFQHNSFSDMENPQSVSMIMMMMNNNDGSQSPPPYLEATKFPPNTPTTVQAQSHVSSQYGNDYDLPKLQQESSISQNLRSTEELCNEGLLINNNNQNKDKLEGRLITTAMLMMNGHSSGTLLPTNRP